MIILYLKKIVNLNNRYIKFSIGSYVRIKCVLNKKCSKMQMLECIFVRVYIYVYKIANYFIDI